MKAILILFFTFFTFGLFAQPVISSFSPQSGPAGTVVIITGSGFHLAPSLNRVFFGTAQAYVPASTNTSLTVEVPPGANYGYISVTNGENNLTAYSSIPFNLTFPGGCKPDFELKRDFITDSIPYSVCIGDLDGDSRSDMAIVNYGSNTVSVFPNTSNADVISFAAKVDFVTGSSPKSVNFGDIDGDGRLDMIVTNSGNNSVSVFRNTSLLGSISFAAKVDFTTGGSPWSVSVGDVNGDGKPDLAIANRISWTISVLRNTSTSGVISFLSKLDFATGSSPYSVSIGDLDGDGKPDMAVANSGSNTASVYKNTSSSGAVSFAAKVDFSAGGGPFSVSIGDIDGDGKLDLAVANNGSNNASVFRNTSTPGIINAGSFAARVDFAAGGAPQTVSIGDIDGDGKPDLAVANFTSSSISVLRNASVPGTVSFAGKVDLSTAGQASSLSIADFDNYGKPEVVATNYNTKTFSLFRNIATPAVLQTSVSGNGNPITNGSVTPSLTNHSDFGNVNLTENLIRTYSFQNTSTDSLTVDSIKMSGIDPASFTPGSITPAGKIAPGASKTFTVTFVLSALGVKNATVNIYSSINSGTVCFVQQSYTFAVKANQISNAPVIGIFSPQSGPAGTTVNITGSGFNPTPSNNVVFFGAALASVSASTDTSLTVTTPAGANFQFISVTNLESNLTGYSSMPFIVTFPGGCKTDLAAGVNFSTGGTPYSVSISDLDKDGKPDIAVANYGSNTVSVFRNISTTGGVSFSAKVDFVSGSSPNSVSIGDIDGDGKPDIVVTNSGTSNSVSVLRNTSSPGVINAGSFAAKVDFGTGSSPWSVSIGDLNGDGKPDLAVANRVSSSVSVFRNTSTSGGVSFAARVDFAAGSSPYSVSIGDLDGDGKPDMAVANSGSNTASVYQNTSSSGAVSFAAKVDFSAGGGPFSVSIGDIDGDGKLDLAVANNSSNNASVFRNTSTPGIINAGSFAARVDFPAGGAPQIVSLGDIDGDGKPDLAVANFTGNSVSVLRNASVAGIINFSAKVDLASAGQASSVSIGDLDGDGKPEVVATNYNNNILSLFRNIATPSVLQTSVSGNGNPITNGAVIPSLTNHTDFGNVLISGNLIRTYTIQNTSTDSLSVDSIKMSGSDQAIFTAGSITPAGKIAPGASKTFTVTCTPLTTGLKSAAVNIYSKINSGTPCLLQQTYTFAIKATGGSLPVIGTFFPQSGPVGGTVTIRGGGFNTSLSNNIVFFGAALASVSASTDTSLTVTTPAGANFQYISVTNLGSNLTGYSSMPFNMTFSGGCKTEFAGGVGFSTGSTPYSVSIGDLDGDGKSDLAVANYGSNTVSVFRNTSTTGGVSFAAKVDFATGSSPKSVKIGEIDGDGKPDLVVTNSGVSNSVSVFRNTSTTGGVSFAARVDFTTGSSPWSVSIGDINGDGKPDLAVANRTGFSVSVFRNTSTSGVVSFLSKVDFAAGLSPYSISIGDLDGDGKPDIAIANNGDNTTSVYQNTSTSGGVSFAAKVDFSAGSGPLSVSIGDIDGDGKPDLAVANNSGNNASVFRNTSTPGIINSGSFAPRVDFAAGGAPQIVSIGDIDGNGKPDLTVANFTSNSVSVLRNTSVPGTISFAVKVDLGSGGQASSVIIGDIDGNGKPEVAATNYNSSSITVFRNISTPSSLLTSAFGNGNPIANGSVTPSLTNFTDFGNVILAGNLIRTYTFQNTSTDSLSVDSIKISGTDQSLFTPGSITPAGKIAPGGSKTFTVTFAPASLGLKTAAVNIYSNINSGTECQILQTYTFAISGTGTVPVQAKVLNFDGINDNVALPNALPTTLTGASTTEFTIEYWFKGTSLQSSVRIQNGSGYIIAGWNGKHIISTDGGTAGGVNVGAGATDGNWHHIAVTWKKNTANGFKSYLDGALVQQINSANVSLPVVTSGGYLGAYNGSSEWMNGTLDEVRIWKRELSQTEISANRFLEISSGTALLASYHFNQGIAGGNNTGITTLTDATSNNYSGTLINFALNGAASNFVGSGPAITPPSSTVNITAIPEGMYDGGTDRLRLRDTARAYLHSNISPFGVVDSAVAVIDSVTFTGSFIFANAPGGTYYIRVIHRNSIETWSKTGGEPFVQGTIMNYDFSSSAAKAYGNNMVNVDASPVRYALYSGDVNQDGTIDLDDVIQIFNAASVFTSGYAVTDLNGDSITDLSDLLIANNNSAGFVAEIKP